MNFEWLAPVSPVWGTVLHTLCYAALVVWVWRRPDDEIFRDAPDRARWRDLRLWIVPLAALQVAIYWLL